MKESPIEDIGVVGLFDDVIVEQISSWVSERLADGVSCSVNGMSRALRMLLAMVSDPGRFNARDAVLLRFGSQSRHKYHIGDDPAVDINIRNRFLWVTPKRLEHQYDSYSYAGNDATEWCYFPFAIIRHGGRIEFHGEMSEFKLDSLPVTGMGIFRGCRCVDAAGDLSMTESCLSRMSSSRERVWRSRINGVTCRLSCSSL